MAMGCFLTNCRNGMTLASIVFGLTIKSSTASDTRTKEAVNNAHVDGELSDQEVEAFLTSILLIAGVTIFFFIMFHRVNKVYPNNSDNNTLSNEAVRRAEQEQIYRFAEAQARLQREDEDLGGIRVLVSPQSNLLVDGILPHRHGKAMKWKSEMIKENGSLLNGKKPSILAKMPSSKGCNVVLSIREGDLTDESNVSQICDALTAIGSDYNLFCILDVLPTSDNQRTKEVMQKLNGVPADVLPRHRIVAATTVTGRVAFVRQLRPEVVVDFDAEVEKQLNRFGFRVILYEEAGFENCGN